MLPRSFEEVLEGISEWVERLNEDCRDDVIVVEGEMDIQALVNVGVKLRIVHLNKGLSVLSFLENLKRGRRPFENTGPFNRIVIMTDWDRTGGRLASRLEESCRDLDITCDMGHRREISRLTRKWIRDVESLDSLYRRSLIGPRGASSQPVRELPPSS